MSRSTWSLLLLTLAVALAGCEGPGAGAYGFPDRPPAPDDRGPPRAAALEGATRPLAIGLIDDLTLQPVGASYDESSVVDRLAPGAGIDQTYYFWATVPALRRAVQAGLRERGLEAFCDDADVGLAVPYGGTPMPRGVLLLRGELLEFSYSRDGGSDVAAASLAWTLVDADSGRVVARARHAATVRTDEARGPGSDDPLRALGDRLGAQLLADPVVRAALSSRSWSGQGSIEAGAPRSNAGANEQESPR